MFCQISELTLPFALLNLMVELNLHLTFFHLLRCHVVKLVQPAHDVSSI